MNAVSVSPSLQIFRNLETICTENTHPRPKQGRSLVWPVWLKSGIQFSMTSKITRQMIHQARNSAGVLLHAIKEPFCGLFQAVTFSVWQEQRGRSSTQVSSYGCIAHHSSPLYSEILSNTPSVLWNDTGGDENGNGGEEANNCFYMKGNQTMHCRKLAE